MCPTKQLYDEGEEGWHLKLHLGCGGVYLQGYQNIDIAGTPAMFPNGNMTTVKDYYANLDGTARNLPIRRETIVDSIGDMSHLPYENLSVNKIICVQALEHLNHRSVEDTLNHWWDILRMKGVLIISVPEMDGTIELLRNPDTHDFAVRHLGGSRRDPFNFHKSWFNPDDITSLLKQTGFRHIELLPNFHLYPAIVAKGRK